MAWCSAGGFGAFPDGTGCPVRAEGKLLALFNVGGQIYATDPLCTHALAKLIDGYIEDGQVECPLHQGRFDITTGKAMCAPLTRDLTTYPVKVDGYEILLDMPEKTADATAASPEE